MDFFSDQIGNTIPWFGLTHFLLLIGLAVSMVVIWRFSPKIRESKYEYLFRFFIILLVFLFEWRVFENRILNGSIFRLPLCAVSLYGLTIAVALKKEKLFKIVYFYAFGTFLTYLFFDTLWGLDRWDGWTFFGAHAMIAWLAVYGVTVLKYRPTKMDLFYSMAALASYAFISGYAFLKYGGSDELFLFHPPLAEAQFFIDIHPLFYLVVFCSLAALLMFVMYIPLHFTKEKK